MCNQFNAVISSIRLTDQASHLELRYRPSAHMLGAESTCMPHTIQGPQKVAAMIGNDKTKTMGRRECISILFLKKTTKINSRKIRAVQGT